MVAVNPRGSSGRGFDFAKAIYADWGNVDVQDVLAGVDHVVAMGIADPQRLGMGGWSYGAILTNAVIARDTRFKAAISGAGASNMYGMYGHDQYIREYELELGTPWGNREQYDRASFPFLHADRIATPTLFQCARGGPQRALPRRRADVPGLALAQRADAAGRVSGREPPAHRAQLPARSHGAQPGVVRHLPEGDAAMTSPLRTRTLLLSLALGRLARGASPPNRARASSAFPSKARPVRSTRSPMSPASPSAR